MWFHKIAFYLGILLMLSGVGLVLNATYGWMPPITDYPAAIGMGLSFSGMLLWGWGRYQLKGEDDLE
jgi:hypothetical protein